MNDEHKNKTTNNKSIINGVKNLFVIRERTNERAIKLKIKMKTFLMFCFFFQTQSDIKVNPRYN